MTVTGVRRRLHSIAAVVVFAVAMGGVSLPFFKGELFGAIWLVMVAFCLLGALVLWRRPGNPIGWVFAGMGVSGLMAGFAPEGGVGELFGGFGWVTFMFLTVAIVPMLFPSGRTLSPRWRRVLYAALGLYACFAFLWIFHDQVCAEWASDGEDCVRTVDNPIGIAGIDNPESSLPGAILGVGLLGVVLAGLVSLGIRLRRARGVERQQLKWLLLAIGALVGFIVLVDVVAIDLLGLPVPAAAYSVIEAAVWLGLPAAAGISIFRYGLYDIDRIISRTVAYAILVATLTAAYVAAVVGIGALVDLWGPSPEQLDFNLPVVATALVALAFHPLRERARGLANRLVYGKRRTPYEALAGVGGGSLEEVLPQIARLATEATAARRAMVWLSNGVELRPAAAFPDEGLLPAAVPLEAGEPPARLGGGHGFALTHQDDLLGAISVYVAPGEELAADDSRLLSDLASHAAVTLRGLLDAAPLPTGIVTFLMTDIEGSTRLWEEDPDAMGLALRDHDLLVRQTVTGGGGMLIKWRGEGDSTFSVFTDAAGAIVTALALQEALRTHQWPTPRPVSIRAALHTGEAELRERDYFGQTVNRCARLRAIAVGGQTLVSAATRELSRESLPNTVTLRDLGERPLKDMSEPERVYEVVGVGGGVSTTGGVLS
ncbi:MAG: adenylate/guanylate cyclase domain-containing protein [Acidimicrobiia bacterium]